jgi:hypothetical protein
MNSRIVRVAAILGLLGLPAVVAEGQPESQARCPEDVETLLSGQFRWVATKPLVAPAERPEDPCHVIEAAPRPLRFASTPVLSPGRGSR